MNDEQRIWRLISRRMAGETSPPELQELQDLLQYNPGMQYFMEMLASPGRPAKELTEQEVERIYERHIQRLEQKMRQKGMGVQTE